MTYEPDEQDEQDELIGDAMAVGGPAFADELHYAAMEAADAAYQWDGTGDEPAEYRRAWIAAARRLVNERRALLSATPHDQEPRPLDCSDPCAAADPATGQSQPGR